MRKGRSALSRRRYLLSRVPPASLASKMDDQPKAERSLRFFRRAVVTWFRAHGRTFDWRATSDPYCVLVAEVLLQKTPAVKVAKVFPLVVARYPTVAALARADAETLRDELRPLGLPRRAELLITAANTVVEEFGGVLPREPRELEKLPGVGRYTSNAVACFSYGERYPLVDEVVARVYRRYFGLPSESRAYADKRLWDWVAKVTPLKDGRDFAYGVLDIGATLCRPVSPVCSRCPVARHCASVESEAG
jgi:A/G-specific adenine glycosylase